VGTGEEGVTAGEDFELIGAEPFLLHLFGETVGENGRLSNKM
jgi:hypothetical protein